MRESEVESYLAKKVKQIGGLAPKWVSPGQRGVPDRIVILHNGITLYVEVKAPGKKLAPLQELWAKRLTKLGHRAYMIDTKEGVDSFIGECQQMIQEVVQ
ncbi:VRR-NUC domain-containing protein [Bacillus paranthracis]|uniref:VRR-NUC domain-containing protein n=1 Tax=Bacillus paranthracis TaxID=2026186 RepID=UPI00148F2274|nr:VRR-NUC domain-containing protein [Bacillus paranthracis]NOP79610.1 VRR-NUC domain-containing protein [Bacillus paranthracis]